jgi:hypothetical protein
MWGQDQHQHQPNIYALLPHDLGSTGTSANDGVTEVRPRGDSVALQMSLAPATYDYPSKQLIGSQNGAGSGMGALQQRLSVGAPAGHAQHLVAASAHEVRGL